MNSWIKIRGAREHNLKNINIDLPKNKFIVMTGISGSGKSSLAFDTLYQEGQRRYMESLNAYARQFLGNFEKPDVDSIDGLSPSISIDQKTTSNNPRSTVGTVTEIYDYLRLIYARIGTPYCPGTDIPLEKQTLDEMTDRIMSLNEGDKIVILAPVVERQKGTHQKILSFFLKEGFTKAYVDENMIDLEETPLLEKNNFHYIDLVIDRMIIHPDIRSRVYDAVELASKYANGKVKVIVNQEKPISFNQNYVCETDGDFTIPNLEPNLFSFNTPIGACPYCNGLGIKLEITEDRIIDHNKALFDGAIKPFKNNEDTNLNLLMLEAVCRHYGIPMDEPYASLKREHKDIILYGSKDIIDYKMKSSSGRLHEKKDYYEGVIHHFTRRYQETTSEWIRTWIESFMAESVCPKCHGARLNPQALSVRLGKYNIYELTNLSIDRIYDYVDTLVLTESQAKIAKLAFNEIKARLLFLKNVGLSYLTLSRQAGTLSGGEAQRIRLATQIGSKLTGVMYVLDEPSIGLHQKDNSRLIETLKEMRDLGNTLVVVEHDHDTMMNADFLVDIGPYAGVNGGEVVASGTPKEVMENEKSLTGRFLKGIERVEIPAKRRLGNGHDIMVVGAKENNLKNITVSFPIGKMTVVTGVSGSGKSTLVNEILLKGLQKEFQRSKIIPGKYDSIVSNKKIDRVIEISQSPIGRTPRSNPATYTGVFDDIRDLFTKTNEAKARGYQKGRFSFNVRGGRCEACSGDGVKKISMHFLPDVYVTCEVCKGKRYNQETLQIKYKGKNISDVLDMTVLEATSFFENHPIIHRKLKTMYDVGLEYITLGQPATTLSGGEAQRVKLASELYKRITDSSVYILDEPTTGLHTYDVKRLLKVLHKIVDEGATMVIVEHNLDVIKNADYIIDLGPEGGDGGGEVLTYGTPEEVSKVTNSYTAVYLKEALKEA